MFAPSDVHALGHFSWGPLIVRIEWAGSIMVTILALRRAEPHGARIILIALAVLSTALYGALAFLTGGAVSPMFHWILALPIIVGIVLPDLPGRGHRLRLRGHVVRLGDPGRRRANRSGPSCAGSCRRSW